MQTFFFLCHIMLSDVCIVYSDRLLIYLFLDTSSQGPNGLKREEALAEGDGYPTSPAARECTEAECCELLSGELLWPPIFIFSTLNSFSCCIFWLLYVNCMCVLAEWKISSISISTVFVIAGHSVVSDCLSGMWDTCWQFPDSHRYSWRVGHHSAVMSADVLFN